MRVVGFLCFLAGTFSAPVFANPVISEILASNKSGLLDVKGERYDWIEILNPTSESIALDSYFLTDDPDDLEKWNLPQKELQPGGRMVVFASGLSRSDHTNFKLKAKGEFLALTAGNGDIVSEFNPFPAMDADVSYGLLENETNYGFLLHPTPGEANSAYLPGRVKFSHKSGTFVNQFELSITHPDPKAQIFYHVARTPTTADSPQPLLYDTPLSLSESVVVSAHARIPNGNKSRPQTATYILTNETVQKLHSTVPLAIIWLPNGRISSREFEDARFMFFECGADKLSKLGSTPDVTMRAGIHPRGHSSTQFPKKQLRLELRDETGFDQAVSLASLPADSDWVLGAPYADESLVRNALCYELARKIGMNAPRTAFFELFLTRGQEPLSMEDYAGVYVLTESIKAASHRVPVPKIRSTSRNIDTGYILRFESGSRRDVIRPRGFSGLEFFSPKKPTRPQYKWVSERLAAFNNVLPDQNLERISEFIDIDSFINTIILNELTKDEDAYFRSNYFYFKDGVLFNNPVWDFNTAFGNGSDRNSAAIEGWQYLNVMPQYDWYGTLMRNTEFRNALTHRWNEFVTNELFASQLTNITDHFASRLLPESSKDLGSPLERNFEKWRTLGAVTTNLQNHLYLLPHPEFKELRDSDEVYTSWNQHFQHISIWIHHRIGWISLAFEMHEHLR